MTLSTSIWWDEIRSVTHESGQSTVTQLRRLAQLLQSKPTEVSDDCVTKHLQPQLSSWLPGEACPADILAEWLDGACLEVLHTLTKRVRPHPEYHPFVQLHRTLDFAYHHALEFEFCPADDAHYERNIDYITTRVFTEGHAIHGDPFYTRYNASRIREINHAPVQDVPGLRIYPMFLLVPELSLEGFKPTPGLPELTRCSFYPTTAMKQYVFVESSHTWTSAKVLSLLECLWQLCANTRPRFAVRRMLTPDEWRLPFERAYESYARVRDAS